MSVEVPKETATPTALDEPLGRFVPEPVPTHLARATIITAKGPDGAIYELPNELTSRFPACYALKVLLFAEPTLVRMKTWLRRLMRIRGTSKTVLDMLNLYRDGYHVPTAILEMMHGIRKNANYVRNQTDPNVSPYRLMIPYDEVAIHQYEEYTQRRIVNTGGESVTAGITPPLSPHTSPTSTMEIPSSSSTANNTPRDVEEEPLIAEGFVPKKECPDVNCTTCPSTLSEEIEVMDTEPESVQSVAPTVTAPLKPAKKKQSKYVQGLIDHVSLLKTERAQSTAQLYWLQSQLVQSNMYISHLERAVVSAGIQIADLMMPVFHHNPYIPPSLPVAPATNTQPPCNNAQSK